MKCLLILSFALALTSACVGVSQETPASSVRLSPSDFRLIREVSFQGRNLFDLAIEAGMYKRKGTEYLPGEERGAAFAKGRTWHGSHGVGLVAYDPHMKQYAIYYLQDTAVPGHNLEIAYADEDFIFFYYGFHEDLPNVSPTLEVYSLKRRCFAQIHAVTSRKGKFGHSDLDVLAATKPFAFPPAIGWNHQKYAGKEWVPLSTSGLFAPQRVTLEDGIFTLGYHTDWEIDEFVTAIRFTKDDLQGEFDRIISEKTKE